MADTLRDRIISICSVVQPEDLDQAGYEALTFVPIAHIGALGDFGLTDNIVSYDELTTSVTQKQKGIADAGSPQLELSARAADPGQVILRAAALTRYNYAFKVENSDAPTPSDSNTIYYFRGVISGPLYTGSRNQDFSLERYAVGINQRPIIVYPAPGAAPSMILLPSISGVFQVGETLTAIEGTWTGSPTSYTYAWQHDNAGDLAYVAVAAGGTSKTYVPVIADVGDNIRVRVIATNGAGSSANQPSAGSILQA